MAYFQRNYLRRVLRVQEIVKEHSAKGISNEYIFETMIAPYFYISRTTFYNYLGIPAARELRKLKEEEATQTTA